MNKNRKIIIIGSCICMIFAFTFTAGLIKREPPDAGDTAEHVSDELEIAPHDGDVLVDSLKLTEIRGTEKDGDDVSSDGKKGGSNETVSSDDTSDIEDTDKYFDEVRATLDLDRNQVISMLDDVIQTSGTEKEKEKASDQKLMIIDYMNKEKFIESIIRTKNLPESLVLISDNEVSVTVDKQDLSKSDIAKICDIVMRETGRKADQIVIQSKF